MKTATSTSAKSTAKKTVAVKTAAKKASGFKKGSGCYDCGICGKKTRAGVGDDSSALLGQCASCYEEAGAENAIMDGTMTVEAFVKEFGHQPESQPPSEVAAEVTPQTLINDAVETLNALTAETPADVKAAVIDEAIETVKAANAPKAKKEKLTLPKLRRVGDILNALKAGAWIVREDGLYRLLLVGGEKTPVSKRRCIAFISKGVVVPVAAGMAKGFVSAWQLAPEEPQEK